jgi:hypothetical protein
VTAFEYHLTTDDYAAFNLHHLLTSEMGLRQRRFYRLNLAAATAILSSFMIAVLTSDLTVALVAGATGAVVGWALGVLTWKREIRRNIRRMAKGDALGAPGRHVLTLDAEGMTEETPNAKVTAPWSSLTRVDETAQHIFIYTDPVRAFVVPVRIGPENVQELRGLVAAHTSGSS